MIKSREGPKSGLRMFPVLIEGFDELADLALDMRWAWNHSADEVWQELDPGLWALTQNPWVILQTISRDRLRSMTSDRAFREKVAGLVRAKLERAEGPGWFRRRTVRPL